MIRPFGLGDILTLRQLRTEGVAFDLERLLLHASPATYSALLGCLTDHHLGGITCIHEDSDGVGAGFVQFFPRAQRTEWDLAYVSPSLDAHVDAAAMWRKMLSHAIILSAERRVARIYARSAEDAATEDVLRQVGFTLVTREEVFCQRAPIGGSARPRGLRAVTRADVPALNQLYRQVEPDLIQQAEGPLPHWHTVPRLTLMRRVFVEGYVWEVGGKAVAYLGLTSSSRGSWLQVVVRPEHRGDLLPHIRHVLGRTECSTDRPVYCPVFDHSVGLGWVLRTLGFESYARQALLVTHTMARVPMRRRLVVPGLEGSVDVSTPVGNIFRQATEEQYETRR